MVAKNAENLVGIIHAHVLSHGTCISFHLSRRQRAFATLGDLMPGHPLAWQDVESAKRYWYADTEVLDPGPLPNVIVLFTEDSLHFFAGMGQFT